MSKRPGMSPQNNGRRGKTWKVATVQQKYQAIKAQIPQLFSK